MSEPISTASTHLYRDPEIFERERTTIFARSWQFLGLEADMAHPGDYLAETVAGFPIMVLRTGQGTLAGFHNVCRHRAGPLVPDVKGHCGRHIVCQFHDWKYEYSGKLVDPTGFGPAEGFTPSQFNLFPIQVASWRGFIFVNLDLAAPPLIDLLRPLDERLGVQPRRPARLNDRHPIPCNWKVYVENYLDGYHREGIHPGLSVAAGTQRFDVRMNGEVALYEVPARANNAEGLWAWVWPNLGINVYRGVLLLEHMRPESPERVIIDHIFLHEPEDPGVEAAIHNSERITHEDAFICERVQQNLDAGIFQHGVLSPSNEGAVAWFQGRVAKALSV